MKLIIQFLVALIILPYQLQSQYGTHQAEFINCIHEDEGDSMKGTSSTEIEFSARPIQIIEMAGVIPEPQYMSIELQSNLDIDSIKILTFDLVTFSNVELLMQDNGLNGDFQANDNIYTSSLPIRLTLPPFIADGQLYEILSNRCRYKFYLNDGTTKIYSCSYNTFYFSEEGHNQLLDHMENNPVTQLNDSIYYASNLIHIVSDNKVYSETKINYLTSNFQNLGQILGEEYDVSEITIFYSYNDIDRESGGIAGSYVGQSNSIRTKSLKFGIFNHETLHEWVNSSFRNYGLTQNNGHWGFIERQSSGFYSGCNGGVFQDIAEDLSGGGVNITVQNYSTNFSDLELFLMYRLPIDSVDFPLYVTSGEDLNCTNEHIENGTLDSLSKQEFLAKHEEYQGIIPYTDFGDTINYKTILLYDQQLSDEEILLYSFVMKQYQDFFAESTRQHCFANTLIFKDSDGDGFSAHIDCDDNNPNINPDQLEEPYNNIDDDCDSLTLDDDLDQDGFLLAYDCDDNNPNINPDQIEEPYNNIDDDCDAETLDDDLDQDGFLLADDCDDNNPNINPDQIEEPYNGLDDDCDEETLDDDLDQDGFLLAEDCDDTNMNINPDQIEEPYNGLDDDCDEETLDDDLDQDGFLLTEDCDDTNMNINPDQIEEPYNGLDDDCDEETLDDDLDEDGFLFVDDCDDNNPDINPNAEEIANNGIDEDCDGMDLVTSTHNLSDSEIKIYPNPVIDVIYIDVIGDLSFEASLFDLNGKLILTSNNNKSIKVSSIPHGTYLLEIRDKNTRHKVVEKILVGIGN